jgi:hypothetical protein
MCGEEHEHIELVALSDTSSKAKTTSCVAGSLLAHKFKFLFICGTWFFLSVEIDFVFWTLYRLVQFRGAAFVAGEPCLD